MQNRLLAFRGTCKIWHAQAKLPNAAYFAQFPPICRADPLVRAGPPGPAADQRNQLLTANDQGVRSEVRPTPQSKWHWAKPPAPPLQVHCLPWWGRRFRLPRPLAAEFCKSLFSVCLLALLLRIVPAASGQPRPESGNWPAPPGAPAVMGQNYAPPFGELRNAQGAPLVFAQSDDVLPNQSFEITGEGLKDAELFCWGPSATQPGGQKWPIAIQTRNDSVLVATIPEAAPSGLYLVWAGRGGQWSAPLRLNAPQLWWSSKTIASAGDTVRAVGRNLAHKPDNSSASLYLSGPGNSGRWLTPARVDKYFLDVTFPRICRLVSTGYGCTADPAERWGGAIPCRSRSTQRQRRKRCGGGMEKTRAACRRCCNT